MIQIAALPGSLSDRTIQLRPPRCVRQLPCGNQLPFHREAGYALLSRSRFPPGRVHASACSRCTHAPERELLSSETRNRTRSSLRPHRFRSRYAHTCSSCRACPAEQGFKTPSESVARPSQAPLFVPQPTYECEVEPTRTRYRTRCSGDSHIHLIRSFLRNLTTPWLAEPANSPGESPIGRRMRMQLRPFTLVVARNESESKRSGYREGLEPNRVQSQTSVMAASLSNEL